MDFEYLLHIEEDAPDRGRLFGRRERLHGPVRDEVDVELGAEVLDQRRELRAEAPALRREARAVEAGVTGQVIAQERCIMPRRKGEPVIDHDGLNALVERRRHGRVLEAADHHDVVGEGVLAAAQALQLAAGLVPVLRLVRGDDQDVERRLVEPSPVRVRGKRVPRPRLRFLQGVPGARVVAKGFGQQCPPDPLREPGKRPGIVRIEPLLQGTHQARAWVGPVILHGRELVE